MVIGSSVRPTEFAIRNNGIGSQHESNPKSTTVYRSVRYRQGLGSSANWPDRKQQLSEQQKLVNNDGFPSPQGRCLGESNQWCL